MIEAKTLRALAKHSGYKPSSIFRMQPSEILEMLTEKYPDVKEWDESKAKSVIAELLKEAAPAKEEAKVSETPKEAPKKAEPKAEPKKRTRRTKAQIAADKKAAEEAKDEATAVTKDPKRETPTRTRKKKKSPVPVQTVTAGVSSEDVAVLKELVSCLQEDMQRLTRMVDDVSMFMAWFHNVKVDPREPIEHLASIDWDACINDQIKK